jgi:hypothetical protein
MPRGQWSGSDAAEAPHAPIRGGPLPSEAILDALEEYLGQHVGGTPGLAGQSPSRGDLFTLFRQGYTQGSVQSAASALLTGGAIRDELLARALPPGPSAEPCAFLDQVVILRNAWSDALDRYQEGA